MFSIRKLTEEDYPILCEYWRFWRFPAPPPDCLPDNGLGGAMVCKGNVDICAGFLYETNSSMAWIEWIVSNPNYKDKDRTEAIQFLIKELAGIAKEKGFRVIFTSVKNQRLINHYKECGFSYSGSNTTEMVLLV